LFVLGQRIEGSRLKIWSGAEKFGYQIVVGDKLIRPVEEEALSEARRVEVSMDVEPRRAVHYLADNLGNRLHDCPPVDIKSAPGQARLYQDYNVENKNARLLLFVF